MILQFLKNGMEVINWHENVNKDRWIVKLHFKD